MYKSGDVQSIFNVSSETVRRWSDEFGAYLSDGANPGSGRVRMFSTSDLRVFALVSEVKNSGGTYEDVHARLQGGERGTVDIPMGQARDDLSKSAQLAMLSEQLTTITRERDEALVRMRDLEKQVIQLETKLEERAKDDAEVSSLRKRIEDLVAEVAVLKYQLQQTEHSHE